MEQAANLEASTEKSPVSPGEVLPAIELLGDLWMTLGKADAALAAYEQSLARSPGRLNSLVGAASAAAELGATETARAYRDTIAHQLESASPRNGLLTIEVM